MQTGRRSADAGNDEAVAAPDRRELDLLAGRCAARAGTKLDERQSRLVELRFVAGVH